MVGNHSEMANGSEGVKETLYIERHMLYNISMY